MGLVCDPISVYQLGQCLLDSMSLAWEVWSPGRSMEDVEAVTDVPHHHLRVNNALHDAVIPISGVLMARTYGDQCL